MNLIIKEFANKYLRVFMVLTLCLAQLGTTSFASAADSSTTSKQDQAISVSIPVTDAVWTTGKTMKINWTAGDTFSNSLRYIQGINVTTNGSFNIEYELKTLGISGDYSWVIPSWLPSGKYKIRVGVQPIGYGAYDDSSEFNLSATTVINPPTPTSTVATITVNTVKPLVSWQTGQVMPISWTATGTAVNSLRYIKAVNTATGGMFSIENGAMLVGSSGSYNWSIPNDFPVGKYKIRVGVQPAGYGVYGDGVELSIVAPPVTATPSVTISNSSSADRLWQVGDKIDYKFSISNLSQATTTYSINAERVDGSGAFVLRDNLPASNGNFSGDWRPLAAGEYYLQITLFKKDPLTENNAYIGIATAKTASFSVTNGVINTALPDLAIKNVKVSYPVNDQKVNAQVEFDMVNNGAGKTDKLFNLRVVNETNGQVLKEGEYNGAYFVNDYTAHVYVMDVNNISKLANGTNKLKIYIDSNNVITESNKDNNSASAIVNYGTTVVVPPTVSGKSVDSPYLFALNGQKDDEGDVDYVVYASFNRVIAGGGRNGKGVERVGVNFLKEKSVVDQCFVNLLKNTNTCSGRKSVSVISQNENQQALLKINLDPQYYDSASFEVQYSSQFKPTGWTVDIGDSILNDGWGGDAGSTSNDAEVNVVNGDILVYGNDFSPEGKRGLAEFNKSVAPGSLLVLNISNNHFDWNLSSSGISIVKDTADVKPVVKLEDVNTKNEVLNKTEDVDDVNEVASTVKNQTVAQPAVINVTSKAVADEGDTLIIKLQRQITSLEQKIVDLEKSLVTKIDDKLTDKLKGRILLQVEDKGQAWYVDPSSKNKLYLKDGQAAYDIMRALGLGIKTVDLDKIPTGVQKVTADLPDADGDGLPDDLEKALGTDPNKTDTDGDGFMDSIEVSKNFNAEGSGKLTIDQKLISRMKGRILLQVEDKGQAWYVNPTDGKKYFLGDGNTAYEVMRNLSLGINNDQLRKIQVGEYAEQAE